MNEDLRPGGTKSNPRRWGATPHFSAKTIQTPEAASAAFPAGLIRPGVYAGFCSLLLSSLMVLSPLGAQNGNGNGNTGSNNPNGNARNGDKNQPDYRRGFDIS